MAETAYNTLTPTQVRSGWRGRQWLRVTAPKIVLGLIVILAAFLRFYNLDTIGDGNTYYTAAVESMLQSWKNFFFVAAEPGGSVTVDKPPLGLWLQAISAYFLGVNGFAVALPQILAGILSVAVIYHLVKRYFGQVAGLLAAFGLAVTPVAIAVERNNTMDASLTFALLLATWAFVKATDTGRLRWLLLGAFLVGLGFNIKMLQAFLPLPAFYALYFLGSQERWHRKLLNLVLATALLLLVSFSWAVAVDLTPASQRPYVGSSENNTVLELVFGHNGLNRLFGGGGRGAAPQSQPAPPLPPPPPPGQAIAGQGPGAAAPPGGGRPSGSGEIGEPSLWRLFTTPLSNEIGWLLPVGLFSTALLAASAPPRWPLTERHKAFLLWGGWLLTSTVFFNVAEFYHAYYLGIIGPPLAALVAIGVVSLWQLHHERPILAWTSLVVIAIGTVAFQVFTAYQYVNSAPWLLIVFVLLAMGVGLLIVNLLNGEQNAARLGATCLVLAMLVTPAVWSLLTTLEESPHTGLPSAYSGESGETPNPGQRSGVNGELLDYLQSNTQDVKYLMAVGSAFEGASYVIETGRPVLYMGGFSGSDPVVSVSDLTQMVEEGQLRYVLWGGDGRRGRNRMEISGWLQDSCVMVTDVDLSLTGPQSANSQPPGPPGGPGGNRPPSSTLYRCDT